MNLVLQWIKNSGGTLYMLKHNLKKSQLLYSTIACSDGFYEFVLHNLSYFSLKTLILFRCPVKKGNRSRMNIPFRISGGDKELEAEFVEEAKKVGMIGVKGHR